MQRKRLHTLAFIVLSLCWLLPATATAQEINPQPVTSVAPPAQAVAPATTAAQPDLSALQSELQELLLQVEKSKTEASEVRRELAETRQELSTAAQSFDAKSIEQAARDGVLTYKEQEIGRWHTMISIMIAVIGLVSGGFGAYLKFVAFPKWEKQANAKLDEEIEKAQKVAADAEKKINAIQEAAEGKVMDAVDRAELKIEAVNANAAEKVEGAVTRAEETIHGIKEDAECKVQAFVKQAEETINTIKAEAYKRITAAVVRIEKCARATESMYKMVPVPDDSEEENEKKARLAELVLEDENAPEDAKQLALAMQFYTNGEYEEALPLYEALATSESNNDLHHFRLGVCLSKLAEKAKGASKLNFWESACEAYRLVVAIREDKHEAWYNWGNALSRIAENKVDAEKESYLKQALEKYYRATKIKADKHEAWFNWGVALADLAELKKGAEQESYWEQAIGKYQQAIEIKEDKYKAWFNRACVHGLRGDVTACLTDLIEWRKYHPDPKRTDLVGDTDFDPVRNNPAFVAFRDSLPE